VASSVFAAAVTPRNSSSLNKGKEGDLEADEEVPVNSHFKPRVGLEGIQKVMDRLNEPRKGLFTTYRSPMPCYAHLVQSQRPSPEGSIVKGSAGGSSSSAVSPRGTSTLSPRGTDGLSPRRGTAGAAVTAEIEKPKWTRIVNEMDPMMTAIYESMEIKLLQVLKDCQDLESTHNRLKHSTEAFEAGIPKQKAEKEALETEIDGLESERDQLLKDLAEVPGALTTFKKCQKELNEGKACDDVLRLCIERSQMAQAQNDLLLYQMRTVYQSANKVEMTIPPPQPSPHQPLVLPDDLQSLSDIYFHAIMGDQCREVYRKPFGELAIHKDLPRLAKGIDFWDEPKSKVLDLREGETQVQSVRRVLFSLASRFDSLDLAVKIRDTFQPPAGDLAKYLLPYLQSLGGDELKMIRVLKGINQCLIAPVVTRLKNVMENLDLSFNSKRNGWTVLIAKESNVVVILHRKTEQAAPSAMDSFGEFSFDWFLEFSFDTALSTVLSVKCSLKLDSVKVSETQLNTLEAEEFRSILLDVVANLENETLLPIFQKRIRKLRERKDKRKKL